MIDCFIILAYLSLALELWLIPVPSVASALQLHRRAREGGAGERPLAATLRWYAPVALNIAVFLLPLGAAVAALARPEATQAPAARGIAVFPGVALILAGRGLTVASALALRSRTRPGPAAGALHAPLHATGVFAFSRNPGLLGMYLFAAGLLLLKPSPWFAIGLVHYLWHMHRRVKIEERHLLQRLGDEYAAYAARTRRYV